MKGKWIPMTLSIAFAISALIAGTRIAYTAESDIVISEVMFNSYCNNTANATNTTCEASGSFETQFEWVEIYNKGVSAVDIQNWQICDSPATGNCDTITTSSLSIGPGEYWIITNFTTGFQSELTGGGYGTYDASRTLVLGTSVTPNSIGSNGLGNSSDAVYLLNASSQATDCISWASPALTRCAGLTYVSNGTGFDSTLASEGFGQSITNVQGAWNYHISNGSPYEENAFQDEVTNALTLRTLTARAPVSSWAVALPLLGLVAASGLVAWRRRR